MLSEFERSRELEVRQLAYELWFCEGCPENRSEHYWYQAEAMLRNDQDQVELAGGCQEDTQ